MRNPIALTAILASILIVGTTGALIGQTVYVVPSAAYPTIQSAINAAQAAAPGIVEILPGTYQGPFFINSSFGNVTIRGTGDPSLTILDGAYRDRVFEIVGNGSVTLQRLTITRGRAPTSPLGFNLGFVTFGGGISAFGGSLLIEDVVFFDNAAESTVSPSPPPFLGVSATGGAIGMSGGGFAAALIVRRCTFDRNLASIVTISAGPLRQVVAGGAINCSEVSQFIIEDSTFIANYCSTVFSPSNQLAIPGSGGAVATSIFGSSSLPAVNQNIAIRNCSFVGNQADFGAALTIGSTDPSMLSPTRVVENCAFVQNHAMIKGGALRLIAVFTVSECLFSGNTSGASAGAAWLEFGTLRACRFLGNQALQEGGAVSMGREARIESCLFAGNTAVTGAAIRVEGDSTGLPPLSIDHCTISGNTVLPASPPTPPGGYFPGTVAVGPMAAVELRNSILWGNAGALLQVQAGGSLVLDDSDVEVPWMGPGGGNLSLDPRFIAPASSDFRLLPDSPCIDAAQTGALPAPPIDVDGNPRVLFGQPDMGAHEFGALGETGTGQVGTMVGSTEDVLFLDGSSGGPARVHAVPFGQPVTLLVAQPSTTPTPARFLVWGLLDVGGPHSPYLTPIGLMSFTPLHADPSDPRAFVIANTVDPDPAALVPGALAPWAVTSPGIFFPLRITIQAAIEDGSVSSLPPFSITNGIVLSVE